MCVCVCVCIYVPKYVFLQVCVYLAFEDRISHWPGAHLLNKIGWPRNPDLPLFKLGLHLCSTTPGIFYVCFGIKLRWLHLCDNHSISCFIFTAPSHLFFSIIRFQVLNRLLKIKDTCSQLKDGKEKAWKVSILTSITLSYQYIELHILINKYILFTYLNKYICFVFNISKNRASLSTPNALLLFCWYGEIVEFRRSEVLLIRSD